MSKRNFFDSLFGPGFFEGKNPDGFFGNDFNCETPDKDDPNYKYSCVKSNERGLNITTETWISLDGTRSFTIQHAGHSPFPRKKKLAPSSLPKLLREIDKAVSEERYEDAAKLRDQIKELQKVKKL